MSLFSTDVSNASKDVFYGGKEPKRCRIINSYIEKNNSELEAVITDLCINHILYPPPVPRNEEEPVRYGITFLNIKDKDYLKDINTGAYEDGDAGKSIRLIKNLILREHLDSTSAFQTCLSEGGYIKTASGWFVKVAKVENGEVHFDGGMVITKDDKFKAPGEKLAIWTVKSGIPTTIKNPGMVTNNKQTSFSSDNKVLESLVHTLHSNHNVIGMNMLTNIISQFTNEYNKNRCIDNNVLQTMETSIANYLYAYDGTKKEYNTFVKGMRPLAGVGMMLRFVDGDKKNFMNTLLPTNDLKRGKNRDVLGWGYREIYTTPIIDNWTEHYDTGRKDAKFSTKDATKNRKTFGGSSVDNEVIDEIKEAYGDIDQLWKDMASHVIAQDIMSVFNSSGSVGIHNFDNTLSIAKSACNGVPKKQMFDLNNNLRSEADMQLFKTFVKSSSFSNNRPAISEITEASGAEDYFGKKLINNNKCLKEDSSSYLKDYLSAKGIRGGTSTKNLPVIDESESVTMENSDNDDDYDDGPTLEFS